MTANLMEYLGFVCGLAATVTSWVTWGAASKPSAAMGSPAINPAGPVVFRKDRRLTSSVIAISPLRKCSSPQGPMGRELEIHGGAVTGSKKWGSQFWLPPPFQAAGAHRTLHTFS